ncbi:hypothetical protein [Lysobacter gummosus]|uniref:hypothetical protein n=1 Tax=Lysobacter gummosus TaxID=262324 RepID=UPI00363A80E2
MRHEAPHQNHHCRQWRAMGLRTRHPHCGAYRRYGHRDVFPARGTAFHRCPGHG